MLRNHVKDKTGKSLFSYIKKAAIQTEMSNRKSDNTKRPPISVITQLLQADLHVGRSVGGSTATQLVRLTGILAQPSHYTKQPCTEKDVSKKM